jgi:hypothetical protein
LRAHANANANIPIVNFEEGIDLGRGDDHNFIVNDNKTHNVETHERIF